MKKIQNFFNIDDNSYKNEKEQKNNNILNISKKDT